MRRRREKKASRQLSSASSASASICSAEGVGPHVIMAIVRWGDVHMSGKKGRPVLHRHTTCGHRFDPLQVYSVCAEALNPRETVVEPGPGAAVAPKASGKVPAATQTPTKNPTTKSPRKPAG